jgi:hypothetical protein
MWDIFANLLDPDTDFESGSGYETTDLIESGIKSGSETLLEI